MQIVIDDLASKAGSAVRNIEARLPGEPDAHSHPERTAIQLATVVTYTTPFSQSVPVAPATLSVTWNRIDYPRKDPTPAAGPLFHTFGQPIPGSPIQVEDGSNTTLVAGVEGWYVIATGQVLVASGPTASFDTVDATVRIDKLDGAGFVAIPELTSFLRVFYTSGWPKDQAYVSRQVYLQKGWRIRLVVSQTFGSAANSNLLIAQGTYLGFFKQERFAGPPE
jgi:hypothetical protein